MQIIQVLYIETGQKNSEIRRQCTEYGEPLVGRPEYCCMYVDKDVNRRREWDAPMRDFVHSDHMI